MSPRLRRTLRALRHYVILFLLTGFIATCCMTLFLNVMTRTMDLTLTEENIRTAAKLTFLNVLLLSLLFTAIDAIRRRLTVGRPVEQITEAARKISQGDFSVRIRPLRGSVETGFNEIIDCFNRLAAELAGTETLQTDFIANVSHELKTPLAVIQNYSTMLQQPGLPEAERLELARAITHACRRLADLITNILKLNKLENQQIFPAAEDYDLSEQLCESLLQFEDLWEKKGLNIETDLEEGVLVCADRELLYLVWNNLLSNAMKFTPAGGTVSVTLRQQGSTVAVSVADTGCGMRPEVGAHIFEKFYQGDRSHATQGNGLGLALVKRIIDIVGGEISVQSTVGLGSTFTVRLRRDGQ
ncbi:MAG: HAMP domain-containing histidine kinase [Oscillospiraceae bacterium]|nr:HAMP domain-containing histidine kinase [Oscillospiraceae bacterium]